MTFKRFDAGDVKWADPELAPAVTATVRDDGRVARVLAELDALEQCKCPEPMSAKRWHRLRQDLRHFTKQWLDLALAHGWTLLDLYGSPRDLHHRRLDQTGLVLLLDGREIESIGDDCIVIRNRSRGIASTNTFWRISPGCNIPFDRTGGDLIWVAVHNAQPI